MLSYEDSVKVIKKTKPNKQEKNTRPKTPTINQQKKQTPKHNLGN